MKPDLQRLLAFWQAQLNLTHWKIRAKYVKNLCTPAEGAATGHAGEPVYGLCYPLADNRTATIQIRDPDLSDDGVSYPSSMVERTLVHEVFHCKVAETGLSLLGPAAGVNEEQLVWDTSDALVRLRGTPAGARLCAAVRAAIVGRVVKQASLPRASGARRNRMDPLKVFLIALRALLTQDDPKPGIEALIKEMESAGLGGGDDAPPGADDLAAGPSGDDPGMSARAADCLPGDKPAAARSYGIQRRAAASLVAKPLTGGDVIAILAEEREKEVLIAAARASRVGITPPFAMHLQSLSLAAARKLIEGLDIKPAETATVRRAAVAVACAHGTEQVEELSDEAKKYLDSAFPATAKLAKVGSDGAPVAEAPTPGAWTAARLREEQQKAQSEQRARADAARRGIAG